jgi:prevent-host-death family protein
MQMSATEFKAKCLSLMDQVAASHESVVITKHGQPVAQLVPVSSTADKLFGCLTGSVTIHGDIINGTGETWNADV